MIGPTRIVTVVLAGLFLSSCAMGPDYSRPGLSLPDGFRLATMEQEAESFANLPWWDLLQDEDLRLLVRIALAENKDLKRAVASVEDFQARLLIAKMDFAPKADGVGNARSFGRKANFLFPWFRIRSIIISRGTFPGSSIFGGGSGGRTKPPGAIFWRARRPGARWCCNW